MADELEALALRFYRMDDGAARFIASGQTPCEQVLEVVRSVDKAVGAAGPMPGSRG